MKVLRWQEASLESSKGLVGHMIMAPPLCWWGVWSFQGGIVHVGNAADHLRQISVCEPAVQWAIEYALLCNPPVLWRTTPIIKYSWPTCYFGMPGLGRASQIWQIASLHGIRWKSSDDKKPAWNRAKVFKASPSKIQAYKHAKFESLIPRATIASAKRSNILSSKHRGLERSAAEAVACKPDWVRTGKHMWFRSRFRLREWSEHPRTSQNNAGTMKNNPETLQEQSKKNPGICKNIRKD